MFSIFFLDVSYLIKCVSCLKCVTLRFVNNADMIETPLRSIISSGVWGTVLTPAHSAINLQIAWTINTVTKSFCLAIFYLSEIRSVVSTMPCSISFPTSTLYSFRDITFPWPSHMLASDVNVISPRGPRVYLSVIWMDKSHSWSMLPLLTLSQYLASPL